MTLNYFLRRASSFLGMVELDDHASHYKAEEGEVIYCKNNVCVHPPVPLRNEAEHHPGYLSIRAQQDEMMKPTLILTWIPNTIVKKHPQSLENKTPTSSPCRSSRSSACPTPHRSPRHSLSSIHSSTTSSYPSTGSERSVDELLNCFCQQNEGSSSTTLKESQEQDKHHPRTNGKDMSQHDIGPEDVTMALEAMISKLNNDVDPVKSFKMSRLSLDHLQLSEKVSSKAVDSNLVVCDNSYNVIPSDTKVNRQLSANGSPYKTCQKQCVSPRKKDLKLNLNDTSSQESLCETMMPNISITKHSDAVDSKSNGGNSSGTSRTSFCDPDSLPPSPSELDPYVSTPRYNPFAALQSYYIEGTPESLALVHRLSFPEQCAFSNPNTASPNRKANSCNYFSVDLGQMKSLRLFFSNKECTCGQLVIASCESQYKILHFHHGGLEKLAAIFGEWDFLMQSKQKGDPCPYRQFSICRPEVSKEECHPEEGLYGMLVENTWRSHLNDLGQIDDDFHLRQTIFFGGLDGAIRHEVWPFLLHYYPYMSTSDEREQIRNDCYIEYHNIRKIRENMTEEEREIFWRTIQCTVEKDVVRTDRAKPFFAGDNNPNLEIMRNILLNYAIYNPTMGYTQGMSDLLAPILTEIQTESDAFWCFVGLMQRTIFISSPKDNDMDKHLNLIRELIRLMVPTFYQHLENHGDALELLFCHRWILLCFKREFPESDAMKIWESCWAHYQTDYFHLFLCVAIIAIYNEDVIGQDMNADEMLLYFSSLAMHMNGDLVLRKARGLLHHFRQKPRIPCTLKRLCEMCGPGMWDSGHVPIVECVGHDDQLPCPDGGELHIP